MSWSFYVGPSVSWYLAQGTTHLWQEGLWERLQSAHEDGWILEFPHSLELIFLLHWNLHIPSHCHFSSASYNQPGMKLSTEQHPGQTVAHSCQSKFAICNKVCVQLEKHTMKSITATAPGMCLGNVQLKQR